MLLSVFLTVGRGTSSLLLVAIVLIVLALPVLAIGDPSSISIESVRVFQNIFALGDRLVVIEEKVMYTPDPPEWPEDAYTVGIYSEAVQKFSRPLSYYDHSASSIYVSPSENLTWEGPYSVKVYGNPSYFPPLTEGLNMKTMALSGGNWISGGESTSRIYLGVWVLALAEEFHTSWGIAMLTASGKLNAVAAAFFEEVIPGLQSVCPTIFEVASSYLPTDSTTFTKSYETDLLSRAGAHLTATLAGISGVTGIPVMLVGGILLGIMFFVLAGRIFTATGNPGLAIGVGLPFIFAGNIIGLLPLSITFIGIALVLVVFALTFVLGHVG